MTVTVYNEQDLVSLENGLYKLIDMQKEEKQRKEDAKRMREEEKMRKYGRTKPMTFDEIYAQHKAKQPTDRELRDIATRRLREQEQSKGEQQWLENKRRRESFYSPYSKAGARFSQDSIDALEAHVTDLQDTANTHARELKQKASDLTELWRNEGQGSPYA